MSRMIDKIKESDIFSHIASFGYLPRWIVLIFDIVVIVISYMLANILSIKYYYYHFEPTDEFSYVSFLITIVVQIVWFWIFHTYSGILRFSTFVDAVKLLFSVGATTISIFVIDIIYRVINSQGIFMRVEVLFYSVISFLLLFGLRLGVKTLYDMFYIQSGHVIPVVVYGTKAAGVSIAKMIRSTNDSRYKVIGFIDDSNVNKNKRIFDLPIYSIQNTEKFLSIMRRKKIRGVVVSPFKMSEINLESGLDIFINNNIQIFVLPKMNKWKEGDDIKKINVEHSLRNISIDELLNRELIKSDNTKICKMLSSKVVLVTGAAGSIGSEIVRQVSTFSPKLIILFDNAESPLHNIKLELLENFPNVNYAFIIGDVRNKMTLERLFGDYPIDVVFHAAAYKHVPLMEDFPSQCALANVLGTRNLADLAVAKNIECFVMVSTDKAVNPTNVMGASKRMAEIYVQSYYNKLKSDNESKTKFITTRFGNVLGSNGSVIPLFKHQIEKGGPVTVTHPDIIRYFMTIPEACQLVLQAATLGNGGEIFVFDMGKAVKISALAEKMIRFAGMEPGRDIEIKYTGLRPGEKLYEELLNNKEITEKTTNDKIMIAKVREYDHDSLIPQYDKIIEYANLGKDYLVVKTMKELIPEYKSQNSIYEQIDMNIAVEKNKD